MGLKLDKYYFSFASQKNYERISNLFFLLLYPGFILYNLLIGYGWISPIAGGWFGSLTVLHVLIVVLFAPFLLKNNLLLNGKIYFLLLVFYLLLISFTAVLSYSLSNVNLKLPFIQHVEAITLMISAIALSFGLNFKSKALEKYSLIFLALIALFFLYYVATTGSPMFYMRTMADDAEGIATYQGFSRGFMLVGFLILASTKNASRYFLWIVISFFVLFVSGSRSEFVAFLFAAGLLNFAYTKQKTYVFVLSTLFFLLALIVANYLDSILETISSSRIFKLADLSQDTSWDSRDRLLEVALQQISDNPFLGVFGGHFIEHGTVGSYAHNIISVWASYGVLPFLLYVFLVLLPFISSAKQLFILNENTTETKFLFLISSAVLLLLVFAKSVFWFVPGIVFGLYLKSKVVYD